MAKDLKKIAKMIKLDQGRMEAKRKPRESRTKCIDQMFRPSRLDLDDTREEGDDYKTKKFFHWPPIYLYQHGNAFAGATSSKRLDWFNYGFSVEALNDLDSSKGYFQDARDQMRNAFERSNFYDEDIPLIEDAVSDGNGFMEPIHDLDLDEARFLTQHPGDVWISRDKYGKVNRVHIRKTLTAEQAYDDFKDNKYQESDLGGNLPDDLIRNATEDTGNPLSEYTFIHARWKNPDRRIGSILSEDKEFLSAWVCSSNSEIVELNGVDALMLEWTPNRASRNVYGTGLCALALDAAQTGDSYEKKKLQMAALAAEPRNKASKTLRGRIDRRPGATIWMADGESYEPVDDQTNFTIPTEQMDEAKEVIRGWLWLDLLLAMSSIENPKDITATFISQLQGEKAQVLTSTLTGYEDFLNRVHEFVWKIEENAGRMPEMPQELADAIDQYEADHPGSEVSITPNYIGPLFQIQQEFLKTGPLLKGLDYMERVITMYPEAQVKVDGDKLLEEGLDGVNFPESIQRTDGEVEEVRAAQAEAAAAQAQQDALQAGMENISGLDKTIEPDSVIDKAMNA